MSSLVKYSGRRSWACLGGRRHRFPLCDAFLAYRTIATAAEKAVIDGYFAVAAEVILMYNTILVTVRSMLMLQRAEFSGTAG